MNKNLLIGALALVALVGAGLMLWGAKPAETPGTATTPIERVGQRITVSYENNSFNPEEVRVKVGDTVIFDNKGTGNIRVSSDPHPTHTSFPALESEALEPGNTYQLTLTEPGTVNYHDHLNAKAKGKIIVEQ